MVIEPNDASLEIETVESIELTGNILCIEDVIQVSRFGKKARVTSSLEVRRKIYGSHDYICQAVEQNQIIYGVTTNFGGMATKHLDCDEKDRALLQENLLWGLKCSVGKKLSPEHIRASMLIRANALARGASGIRFELIERLLLFLNNHFTPVVREYGSIGASGDLVPLASVAGAILGLSPSFKVDYQNQEIDSLNALKLLGLEPIKLKPKEGLALVNGTSFMTGIATNCIHDASQLFHLSLHIHAFYIQALQGSIHAFHPFVHEQKPHKGQKLVAKTIRELIQNSELLANAMAIPTEHSRHIQDRYSLRCLPQYLGVIHEGLETIKNTIESEINSANDNPLIDAENNRIFHCGNFLGEYIAISMDHLRHYIGLVAKHLDTQIALLVTPEFSGSLPPSLAGNPGENIQFGLKGLQICANSIMPILLHLGNNISHLYPTHAEQYNQNINSQGFASANLAWSSIETFRHYIAISLIFAIQSVDLRTFKIYGNYDTTAYLSPKLIPLYNVIYQILEQSPTKIRPLVVQNNEQNFDEYISKIVTDLSNANSKIYKALYVLDTLKPE